MLFMQNLLVKVSSNNSINLEHSATRLLANISSHKNINKVDTYVAIYQLENKEYVARKCIYSLNEELFSVIEVFLFDE